MVTLLICIAPNFYPRTRHMCESNFMDHGKPAGNGSQWPLMAAELLQSSPAFRESMHACAKAVAPYGLDLLAEMVDPEGWKSSAASASGLASVQVLICPP